MMGHYWLELLNNPSKVKLPFYGLLIEGIKETEAIIRIDNVAQYFWQYPNQLIEPKNLPNVAPPFGHFWMEYKARSGKDVGILVRAGEIDDPEMIYGLFRERGDYDFRWVVTLIVIAGDPVKIKSIGLETAMIVLGVRADGTIGKMGHHEAYRFFDDPEAIKAIEKVDAQQSLNGKIIKLREQHWFGLVGLAFPGLLALCFMNCKNVELIPRPLVTSKPAKGKMQNRGPVDKFHVLKIDPIKRVLDGEGQSGTKGLKHALHICRGHFKDYQSGAGLFGKYKGLYWWDSHVRGDHTLGTVTKDYDVRSPARVIK